MHLRPTLPFYSSDIYPSGSFSVSVDSNQCDFYFHAIISRILYVEGDVYLLNLMCASELRKPRLEPLRESSVNKGIEQSWRKSVVTFSGIPEAFLG